MSHKAFKFRMYREDNGNLTYLRSITLNIPIGQYRGASFSTSTTLQECRTDGGFGNGNATKVDQNTPGVVRNLVGLSNIFEITGLEDPNTYFRFIPFGSNDRYLRFNNSRVGNDAYSYFQIYIDDVGLSTFNMVGGWSRVTGQRYTYKGMQFPGIDVNGTDCYTIEESAIVVYDSVNNTASYWGNNSVRFNTIGGNFNRDYIAFFAGLKPVDDDNPYWEGGTSDEGGGGGNFSDSSDDVDVDELPTIDAIGTGFATLFTPSKAQLTSLADVMWDSNIFTALQNLVENIQNMFTSLAIVPFEVTQGSTVEVTWLGLPITGLRLTLASKQYYEFDMGSINLASDNRIFTSGSALDYSPFSKLGIFLPFIGFQDLDIDECRGATIGLKYRIDILSGTCVALISIGGNTIYQFTGNCLSQIPITNENMQSLVTDAVNVGIAAAATHSAQGAASADMASAEGEKNIAQKEAKMAHAEAHLTTSQGRLASATANAAMGMKPTFGKAGAISASASLLAVKQPYLFLTTPRQSIPDHYQRYCGFPSNISGTLNQFSGFTVVEDIRLNGLVATSPEVAEIYSLLKSGVII